MYERLRICWVTCCHEAASGDSQSGWPKVKVPRHVQTYYKYVCMYVLIFYPSGESQVSNRMPTSAPCRAQRGSFCFRLIWRDFTMR